MSFKKTGNEKPAQMATDDSNDEFSDMESESDTWTDDSNDESSDFEVVFRSGMWTDDSNDESSNFEFRIGMYFLCFVHQSKWKSDIDCFHYMKY